MARNFVLASVQYLNVGTVPVSGYPFTLACWFRSTNTTTIKALVAINSGFGSGSGRYMIYANANVHLYCQDSGASSNDLDAGAFTSGAWTHACGVFASSTSFTIYRDGGNSATGTTAVAFDSPDRTSVGNDFATVPNLMDGGDIAECGIWDAALTAAEAASLARGAAPLRVRQASLAWYAPLVGRTSPEIEIVGGQSLTLTNAPANANHPRIIYTHRRTPAQDFHVTAVEKSSIMLY